MPWCLGRASCGAMTFTGIHGQPRDCVGRVTHAGLVLVRDGRPPRWRCWLSFSCVAHASCLTAPRSLLPKDEVVRRHWAAQRDLALAGKPFERSEPLSMGAEAKRLHARALAWAAKQQADELPSAEPEHP